MTHRIALGAASLAALMNLAACSSCSPAAPGGAAGSTLLPPPLLSASARPAASAARVGAATASAGPSQATLPPCPTFPAPKAPPPPETPPAAARACAAQVEASEKKANAVSKEAATWRRQSFPGIARCAGDAAGSWLLAIESFKATKDEFSGVYRLVRVTAEGKVIATNFHEDFGHKQGGEQHSAEITASVDIDKDGAFEVLLRAFGSHGDEDAWSTQHLYRLQGKGVTDVLPLDKKAPPSIEQVTDVDGDGRLDLVLESPFSLGIPCTLDGTALGPRVLLHGTPAGFSPRDEVAQNFARLECLGAATDRLLTIPAGGDSTTAARRTTQAIGCARLGGASASEVKERLAREMPGDLTNTCIPELKDLATTAAVDPPLTVDHLACRP
jgi:hypothetical protein